MSSRVPRYIPAPNWDIPADSNAVVLGRIITDTRDPESQVAKSQVAPIAAADMQMVEKTHWSMTWEQLRAGKVGLWAKCLQLVPLGGQVSFKRIKSAAEDHQFETLETLAFLPDEEYTEKAVLDPGVQAYLQATARRKPLYMITGLKIARGARAGSQNDTRTSVHAEMQADLLSTGVLVNIGPGVSSDSSRNIGISYSGSTDYIFAYRLKELKRNKKGSARLGKYFVKGAVFGMEDEVDDGAAGQSPGTLKLFEFHDYEPEFSIPDTVEDCSD